MLDYALNFYNNYTIIFYILIIIVSIIEGPITILTLSIIAPKFGFSFYLIYFIGFIGELFGDLLHYFVGKFLKKNFFNGKDFEILKNFENKIKNQTLFDKIIIIKYTPPITTIGLIYLGFQKINFKIFFKNIVIFSILNSLIITFIGFNFGRLLKDKYDFEYIIFGVMLSFIIIYLLFRLISYFLIKKVLNEKK